MLADGHAVVEDLLSLLARIETVVHGRDKGIDRRVEACRTMLELARESLGRGRGMEPGEVAAMLDPFVTQYGGLVAELDVEGQRSPGGEVVGSSDSVQVPTASELKLVIRSRLGL